MKKQMLTTYFHPIFFVAEVSPGEVRIWKWQSLDDALKTMRRLVPTLNHDLTTGQVIALAGLEWDALTTMSFDEAAAFWLARTVYDPGIPTAYGRGDMFSPDQAVTYARQLMTGERPRGTVDFRSRFAVAACERLTSR